MRSDGLYFFSRILRQKCKYDSEFLAMVNEIKTTAKDSLGLLILLPVGFSYVLGYEKYLRTNARHAL